ncbi:unnamed protein product [Nyctereutes procyonoides]|uniref:(raccoon dog) hypothetical protein n=1 Tax=Nyctereutes procyonoides TaxID=34880 RepID=A0A811Y916_NYCPR|nr:unnamed protein product [Nyctereutes procyonoides]
MAGLLTAFLKDAWAKELVLVAPFTKYTTMTNQVNYGNVSNVPSHYQDPHGPSLE